MITIRPEQPIDFDLIRVINKTAFGTPTEAKLVDLLRKTCPDVVSLVAEENEKILGHIFFSPVSISGEHVVSNGMGLGPMAVRPDRQRQGIGSMMVQAGIEEMRELNCPFIVVLGHPEYYPRFGFSPAFNHSLTCQWENVPDDAFMILILDQLALEGVSGIVRYRDEFDQAM